MVFNSSISILEIGRFVGPGDSVGGFNRSCDGFKVKCKINGKHHIHSSNRVGDPYPLRQVLSDWDKRSSVRSL